LLVYGEPGVGKTYFCATAQDSEDTRPMLFLDVEGGVVTIRKRKDIDVRPVRSIDDVVQVQNELFKDPSYYKTVVLDSLSELQRLDMRTIMKVEKATARNPEAIDEDVATQRAWGKSRERLSRIIRAYRDLPCHTIMTALVGTEQEDKDSPVKLYYPSMPGKLRGEVPGYFDVVGFMQAVPDSSGGITRTLQVQKTKRVVAKDRTGSLGDIINNPTIPMLWSMINSEG
jgi:hypothetical protein